MSVRWRLGARMSVAAVVTAVPVWIGGVSPSVVPTAQTLTPSETPVASSKVSTAPLTPSASALQRHYLNRVAPGLRPQVVEKQTTIAGGLALRTKAERQRKISVASSKGNHVFTASALSEHDLPSAAMRAYKRAARTIHVTQPGCSLPWTLLAGIGRVESDHGRYGGSTLGIDGVPRPAIVGVALNGIGPVAAIRDTDGGRFDGDRVWDRAVGPMQFIPSTWRGAGRDGDGDGRKSPNDIDDAALAAASYLCHGGGNLTVESASRAAIFSYNPSDYYVDLVSAFARGYRTGTFVIPSPAVTPGSGDGVVHLRDDTSAKDQSAARASRAAKLNAARTRAANHAVRVANAARAQARAKQARARAHAATPRHTPRPSATPRPTKSPKPTPSPSPQPPKLMTAQGQVLKSGSGWTIGGVRLGASDVSSIAARDYDGDNKVESMSDEFDGLAAGGRSATLSYYDRPFRVAGFSA